MLTKENKIIAMGKKLPLTLLIALLFTACKKENDVVSIKNMKLSESSQSQTLSSAPVTLVASIIRDPDYVSDFNYFQTYFTYTGKQLTKSESKLTYPWQDHETAGVITYFYYDTHEQLTNTSIKLTYPPYHPADSADVATAKVTNAEGHIASIEFFRQDGLSDRKFIITYKNDRLAEILDPNNNKTTYEYDEKGNNIKQVVETYSNGAPTGAVANIVNGSFDDHINFQKSLPLWVYFKCFDVCMSRQGATNAPQTANLIEQI